MTSYYRLPEGTTILARTDDLTNCQDYVNCPGVLSMFTLDTERTASHFSNLNFKLHSLFNSSCRFQNHTIKFTYEIFSGIEEKKIWADKSARTLQPHWDVHCNHPFWSLWDIQPFLPIESGPEP